MEIPARGNIIEVRHAAPGQPQMSQLPVRISGKRRKPGKRSKSEASIELLSFFLMVVFE